MRNSAERRERLALVAIVAIGAWLRFQHIGAIEYNIDQVYPIWQALRTLDAGDFPLVGQGTSVLFANPPLTGYFYVPLVALVRQPIAAFALTLTLNTLAIWLAYRALRWLIGARPALVGAALFAANPWIIEDSRRTWVQALAPFFVCLVFWALAPLLTGQTRHPRRRTLIATIGLALFAHTYLLAYALIVPAAILLAVFWRRVPRRPLAAGAAAFALLMALYATGLARDWDTTRARAEAFTSSEALLSGEAFHHAVRLVTGAGYADVRGRDAPADDAALRRDLSRAAHAVWLLALAAGAGSAAARLARRSADAQPREAALILLVWAAAPVLMMSYVSRDVHPFYLLLSVPAGHGLAALGVAPLLRRRGPAALAVGLVAFTAAINGLNAVRFAQNTAAHPGEDLPGTLPLAEATALGSRLRAERAPGMAVFSAMDPWTPLTLAGEVFRADRLDNVERAALIPREGALYVLAQRDPQVPVAPPPGAQPAGSPLVLRDGARIELWRLRPADVVPAHPADIPSDLDVSFAGWSLAGELLPGTTVTLDTLWRVDGLHPDRGVWTLAPYAHLLDAGGARLVIAEGSAIPALAWRAGDLIVQRMMLAVPEGAAGPFALNVGLFDGVRGVNAIFRVPAGADTVFTADIPILSAGN